MSGFRSQHAVAAVPRRVIERAAGIVGPVRSIEPLGGLSGRTVAAVRGASGTVVIKGPAEGSEVAVATGLADMFRQQNVRTPVVHDLLTLDDGVWLVMEHLPHPFPRVRWGADPEAIAMLRDLHATPRHIVEQLDGRYRPCWDAEMTRAASAALGASRSIAGRLTALERRSGTLFSPVAVISADPNPLNWRLDGHGRIVLLDWERLTVASPAIDLAIVLPGLPSEEAVAAVVAAYGGDTVRIEDVLVAKVWTVVELAARSDPGSDAKAIVDDIAPAFVDWLDTIPL